MAQRPRASMEPSLLMNQFGSHIRTLASYRWRMPAQTLMALSFSSAMGLRLILTANTQCSVASFTATRYARRLKQYLSKSARLLPCRLSSSLLVSYHRAKSSRLSNATGLALTLPLTQQSRFEFANFLLFISPIASFYALNPWAANQ